MSITALVLTVPFTLANMALNVDHPVLNYPQPVLTETCYKTPHVFNPNGMLDDPEVLIKTVCDSKLINAHLEI